MKKGKITYLEYEDDKVINNFKRICKIEDHIDYFSFEFLLEKKDKMRLLVYKNNDIITIIRHGSIAYEIKHQKNIDCKFTIFIDGLVNSSFDQKIYTEFINVSKNYNIFEFEIGFNRNDQKIRSLYKIEGMIYE